MLYTIGTSNRSADEFYDTLKSYGVTRLIDVRSKPWSRLPQFQPKELQHEAIARGFKFTWQGKVLGGLSDIPTNVPLFQNIMENVVLLAEATNVAVFCAEGDPKDCHRSWKVGSYAFVNHGLIVQNILRNGKVEDISKTLLRTDAADIPPCLRDRAKTLAHEAEGVPIPKWALPDEGATA